MPVKSNILPHAIPTVIGAPTAKLEGKDLVVKFFFTNPAHIPAGIEQKNRKEDEVLDFARNAMAKNKEVGAYGRLREGRVDTGTPIANNLPMTQPAMLRRGLAANGYKLVDAHWFRKVQEGKTTKFVVVLSFKHGADENIDLGRKTLEAIRKLSNTLWFCHVWENEKNFTVNFVGLQQGTKPSYSIVAREGSLSAVSSFAIVEEDDE
jgi:hypothetical protein